MKDCGEESGHLPSPGVSSESEPSTRPPPLQLKENDVQLSHIKLPNETSFFKPSRPAGTLDTKERQCRRTLADLLQKKKERKKRHQYSTHNICQGVSVLPFWS